MTLKDLDISGKRLLIRVDFNVPMDKDGQISDDSRIVAALPTIKYALEAGAVPVLVSHLGRPKGRTVESLRMDPVARKLGELLGRPVIKLDECVGERVEERTRKARPGEIIMLENIRFYPGEEKNDPDFSKMLAKTADVFVNDAFGTCHRAHASTAGVAGHLPAAAGFLVEKELAFFSRAMESPERPFAAVLGGVKVSDKITVIENLLTKVDILLIGGAMAYTFLKSKGVETGGSIIEEEKLGLASELMEKAGKSGVEMAFPVDHVIARELREGAESRVTGEISIPEGWMGLDIGPKTAGLYRENLANVKTVLWNGPLGAFEIEPFGEGTFSIARFLAGLNAVTILGGGDTASAVKTLGLTEKFSHVSTGGGASLEFLEGRELPGIAALNDI